MESSQGRQPLACVRDAIPADQRAEHAARTRTLFGDPRKRRTIAGGYEYHFAPEALLDVARFVALERLCCPFLRFDLVLEPPGDALRLRLTGPPGTAAFLDAELEP